MTPKVLSIILPVYNVEDYVERCIRSLENQNIPHSEYEIIVVNDGSPDNSRGKVIQLISEFSNIILVDQPNSGVSVARNTGISKAVGNYLLFVDPDDFVLPNTFGSIIAQADSTNCQVMYLGYHFLDSNEEVVAKFYDDELARDVVSGSTAYFLSRGLQRIDPDRSVSILLKTEFLRGHELLYISGVPYLEDGEFIARVLCLAERCTSYPHAFYMRTTRIGSATNSDLFYQPKAIYGFVKAAATLKKFQSARVLMQERLLLNHSIVKFSVLSIQSCCSRNSLHLFWSASRELKKGGLRKLDLSGCRSPYVGYGRLYNFSMLFFLFYLLIRMGLSKFLSDRTRL